MRKLLLIMALLLAPLVTSAGGPQKSIWFCKAVGNVEGHSTLFITYSWADTLPNHYDQREEDFLGYIVKVTKGKFLPSFEAKCRDYTDPKRAEKHRTEEMKTAKRYNFDIKEVNWRWVPDGTKKAE